jgi:hypothetical protein
MLPTITTTTTALPAARQHSYRTPFMLGMMGLGMAVLLHDSITHLGWISAARWSYGLLAGYALYALLTRDMVVARILGFALAAGVAELAADAYLVSVTHTLFYPRPEPMLWDSPAYMPVSWAVVLTQIGYLGWLLPWPTWRTGLLLVPLSGLLIPLYESWAIHAGWWAYHQAPSWWGVPHYIYLAEALLMLPVPTLLTRAISGGRWAWLPTGLAEGAVMLLACLVAYTLAG